MRRISAVLTLLFLGFTALSQAQYTISGKVKSVDGQPIGHVNITLTETKKSTITSDNGSFQFSSIPAGTHTIEVSFIGYETLKSIVEVTGNKELDFELKENPSQLSEVTFIYNRNVNDYESAIGKAAIKPMDMPQSMAVIGETLIRDQQAQKLSDVIKNVNGVYLGTARASTQENFYARGYSFTSNNLFKNGSRINTGTMPEVSSLESVEVLKGGAAILYGNVAPGGIVNMVTKKPKFNFGGEISMRAGSYDQYKPMVDIYGPLTKNVAYRLNGTFESALSYRDQVASKRYYVNPSLLFRLNDKTELIVEGDHLRHEFTPDFGIGSLDNTRITPASRNTFYGTDWQYSTTIQSTASATLKRKLSKKWSMDLIGSYQEYSRDYFAVERIQAKANGDWARPLGRTDTKEKYLTAQANLNGRFKTGKLEHTLLAGVDAERYQTATYNYDVQGKIYDTINLLDANKFVPRTDIPVANRVNFVETPINRAGVYVQDLISISDKLKVLAGVRWSMQEAQSARTTFLQKDSVARGNYKMDKAFSPRVGLVYRPTANTTLFTSYSNSFSVNNGTDIFNNALPASIIDQFEVGVKNILFKGHLTANVTAYRIINNNLAQTAQFDANGLPNNNSNLKELTGQTTSDGIELDITANPAKGFSLMAGYSYNNMRYTETPDTKGSYVEGERLVNTPAHTANGSIFYTFQKGLVKGLRFGASAFYIGDRFGGWNNTTGQTQNYSRLIAVEDFTTFDLSAGFVCKKVSIMAKVSNLTNTYNYYVHENYSINPIPPRMFTATVSYKL